MLLHYVTAITCMVQERIIPCDTDAAHCHEHTYSTLTVPPNVTLSNIPHVAHLACVASRLSTPLSGQNSPICSYRIQKDVCMLFQCTLTKGVRMLGISNSITMNYPMAPSKRFAEGRGGPTSFTLTPTPATPLMSHHVHVLPNEYAPASSAAGPSKPGT